MNFRTIQTKMIFSSFESEFKYIQNCLDFMDLKVNQELNEITKEFNEELKKLENSNGKDEIFELNMTEEDFLNDHFGELHNEHQDISKTFIEAIFIRQIAIMEKFFVRISFDVYYQKMKCKKEDYLLPPNCNIDHTFTDAIKAKDYIERNLNINIKDNINWEKFKTLRNLRHKLAHGENIFILDDKQVQNINKHFNIPLLTKFTEVGTNIHYQMNNKFQPISEVNEILKNFLADIKQLIV